MAEVQDFETDIGEIEAVQQQTQPEPEPQQVEPELPDRYRGKTVQELMKMHQEAEKVISRQGQEVGEIRKLADDLIKSQLAPRVKEPEVKEVDFFENPQEAIRRQIESNPEVQAAKQYAVQAQREMAKSKFQQLHPDASQVIADPDFKEFIGRSRIRQQLLQQADQNYDLEAADELLSTFKQLKAVKVAQQVSQVSEVEKTNRNQALRAAAVDTGGTGESGQKIYRRADLIRLKMTDPVRYEAMNDEILAAYQQGRVR